MIMVNNEHDILKLYKRKENCEDEFKEEPTLIFRGRPANSLEKKNYRLQKGANTTEESVYIYCSNMPIGVEIGDRVLFRGEIKIVASVGYYYANDRILNPSIMSNDYLIKRYPKGITLN